MPRALLERLVGAAVLSLIAVIFVPTILDGNIEAAQDTRALSIPEQASAQPDGMRVSFSSTREAPQMKTETATPVDEWSVQVGSFELRSNADNLAENLKKQGYRSYVARNSAGPIVMYRVLIGPESDRQIAEKLQKRLEAQLGPTRLVPGRGE